MTSQDHLDALEARSIYILREAFNRIRPLMLLWSLGKDSNAMIWLCRKAFFGHVPFPVVHIDTGGKFPEMYTFRDFYAREWGLDFHRAECPPLADMDSTLPPSARIAARKTFGLRDYLARSKVRGVIAGIRRDEAGIRAKERVFSPRSEAGAWEIADQPPEFWDHFNTDLPGNIHLRVHPLLHWTELDIWLYTRREKIPVIDLYFAKNGKRYRSLGDKEITFPVDSNATTIDEVIDELKVTTTPERAGRAMDHEAEDSFERLRRTGYM